MSNVSTWLEDGMRHYAAGDPARALESWYRILEVEPQHAAALQYVAFVREALHLGPAAPPEPAAAAVPAAPPSPKLAPSGVAAHSPANDPPEPVAPPDVVAAASAPVAEVADVLVSVAEAAPPELATPVVAEVAVVVVEAVAATEAVAAPLLADAMVPAPELAAPVVVPPEIVPVVAEAVVASPELSGHVVAAPAERVASVVAGSLVPPELVGEIVLSPTELAAAAPVLAAPGLTPAAAVDNDTGSSTSTPDAPWTPPSSFIDASPSPTDAWNAARSWSTPAGSAPGADPLEARSTTAKASALTLLPPVASLDASWGDLAMSPLPPSAPPERAPPPRPLPPAGADLFDVDIEVAEIGRILIPMTPGPRLEERGVRTSRRFGEDFDEAPAMSALPEVRAPGAPPPSSLTSSPLLSEVSVADVPTAPGSPAAETVPSASTTQTAAAAVDVKASALLELVVPTPPSPPRPPDVVPASPPASTSGAPWALLAAPGALQIPSSPMVAAGASVADDAGASPWDSHAGPAVSFEIDNVNPRASAFESLLKRASGGSVPPVEIARPLDSGLSGPVLSRAQRALDVPVDECTALMTGARELFELGDFSGSLELVEKVLKKQPQHEGARAYLKRNEQTLLKMYESKLGDMHKVPRQLVPPDEVIWMNMHHRAGFILSQVDGSLSYDDILEVSGMDRFDTVRIIADLVGNGIIG